MPKIVDRRAGRCLFGLNPQGYDDARPEYPGWIYECLRDTGVLLEGTETLEIGAGTGRATRKLLEYGATPLTIVEPDERFTGKLSTLTHGADCRIIQQSFEDVKLAINQFDLIVAATSFHWIVPADGLPKVKRLLKKGASAALFWNVLQDSEKEDAFHEATKEVLGRLAVSPSGAPDTVPYALDRKARERDAHEAGFKNLQYFESRWVVELGTADIGKLYEGFSPIQSLDEDARTKLLVELMSIADDQFDSLVTRNITSCLYLFS